MRGLIVGLALVFVVVACTSGDTDLPDGTCSAKACVCEASSCPLDCGTDDACAPACTGPGTCDVTCGTHCHTSCTSSSACTSTVGDASEVTCTSTGSCNVTCTGTCRVRCAPSSPCNVTCPNGAAATKCGDGFTCGEAC